MSTKLINNMKFNAAKTYNKTTEVSDTVNKLWEQSIRSQLLIQLNMILQSKHALNNGFTLTHNARTNTISIKEGIYRETTKIEYKLIKVIFAADVFNVNQSINKPYFEILVKMALNNMTKIS